MEVIGSSKELVSFTGQECLDIIKFSSSCDENHSSVIFKNQTKVFDYFFYTIIRDENSQWIFDRLATYLQSFYPNNTLKEHPQIYLHRYPVGCKFDRHNDSTTHPDQLVNIGVCLNSDYDGGDFIFYSPDEILPKVEGTIYHMNSNRDHEVTEITSGERWSLITFLKEKDLGLSKKSII